MKVKFRTNLGSRDADALSLDHAQCTDGAVVSVSPATGEALAKRGIVEVVEAEKPKPVEVKAVPVEPTIAKAESPAVSGVVKTDPKPKGGKSGK